MKIFKNIVRLLVLTSLSMSLTPLTTAKAATNDAIKVNNTTNSLAIAYSANTTPTTEAASTDTSSNTTTTKADGSPATSTVSVTVLSGILTLEAVPDFNFGTMTVGSIGKLKSNVVNTDGFTVDNGTNTSDATAGRDGNTDGTLSVIDSRNNLKDMPGFTLSAAIGKLNPTNTDGGSTLDAILHLNPMPLINEENNNVSNSATPLKTDKISVSSVTGNSAPVMNLTKGSYNGGLIKATFNTPDSASLEIPNTADNTKTSAKNMNAVVTWTLNAAPATTN
ncbi:hypothetical protein [Companilactobacillus zhachilii]|uniref:hypothetical protein n=1 Tax=Companilactobacillus zhachilii TaxID=2304606 RepID=UPI0040331A6F